MCNEDLVKKAQCGDTAAIERIFENYKGYIRYATLKYHIRGCDEEDIMQLVRMGLFHAIKNFNFKKGVPFNAFAVLCVRSKLNTAINESLKKKNIALNTSSSLDCFINSEEDDTMMNVLPDVNSQNPDVLVVDKITCEGIMAKIKKLLSALEFDIIVRHIKGQTMLSIAEGLGISEKSVDNAIQRSRRKLKEKFVSEENA